MADEGPLARAIELGHALELHHVPYAIGGALAYGIWGIPRATLDVDLNLFVEETALAPVIHALASLGILVDDVQAARDAAVEGQFVVRYGGYRVDLFTSSIPFCDEAARTRVQVPIDEHRPWFLSAESLSVFKMLFFRPKDIADLERLIAVRGTSLDTAYVRTQLEQIVGREDERIVRWDQLTGRARENRVDEFTVERALLLKANKLFAVLTSHDGARLEVELDRSMVGAFRDGDLVRIGGSGALELVARGQDQSQRG